MSTHPPRALNGAPTFVSPRALVESDRTLSLAQLYEATAAANPAYPLFRYASDTGALVDIPWATAIRAIRRAARTVAATVGSARVVALLATSDTITFVTTLLGVLRAGYTVFLVSPRNGAAAVADLLARTRAEALFVSADDVTRALADAALALNREAGKGEMATHKMPTFTDLYDGAEGDADDVSGLAEKWDPSGPGIILHSSGSTGHPKTIVLTNRRTVHWGEIFYHAEMPTEALTGAVMGCHGTPMYHGMGGLLYTGAPHVGLVLAAFKPAEPATFPTPDAVFQGLVAARADFAFTVPFAIEQWAREPAKVEHMRGMTGIVFGGAPLNHEIGDALAAQAVQLNMLYGCTEVGVVNRFPQDKPGVDWTYFAPSVFEEVVLRPAGEGMAEVLVVSPEGNPVSVINSAHEGRPVYATNDLVEPHPTRPGRWRLYGRADEQINLSNGEKTNPLPLELMMNEDAHIKACVMFGQGRFQNGVLIEPEPACAIDPADPAQVEAFRTLIWPTIERVNAYAPTHSRIFREMILVSSPAKPFTFNVMSKGLPRRAAVLAQYAPEINALYDQLDAAAGPALPPPPAWDAPHTRELVRTAVVAVLGKAPESDDADLFRHGADSLTATALRHVLARAVPAEVRARVPPALVFGAPSITGIAEVLVRVVKAEAVEEAEARTTVADLERIAAQLGEGLPARPENLKEREKKGDVVLITGTTGGMGCDALEHLLREEGVERVYAFNRKGSDPARRQKARFEERGLEVALLESPKYRMVEVELHVPGFGLERGLLDEIRGSVTHIIHNAWRVNWSLGLASFDVDLKAARNLVELALSSPFVDPPVVEFVSSIGVFMYSDADPPVPEAPLEDPTGALGTGYCEAKWVVERFLQRAPLRTVVVRLGQIAGDRRGHWAESEWFPSLVKTALFQKCLPDADGDVYWIPTYTAAKVLTEMRRSPHPVLHLIHPRPTPWRTLLTGVASALGVPLVPYAEWLGALRRSHASVVGGAGEVEALRANPALQLVDYWARKEPKDVARQEPLGVVYMQTVKSEEVSETLRTVPRLDPGLSGEWVAAWRRSGFLPEA